MAQQPKRTRAKPLALFFYTVEPTQAQIETIDAYFAASDYYVGYRKLLDPVGKRDIIESNAVCISGTFPTIYTDKFTTDTSKVLDSTPIAQILDGTATAAPKPANPQARMAAAQTTGAVEDVQTTQTAESPLAPISPPSP